MKRMGRQRVMVLVSGGIESLVLVRTCLRRLFVVQPVYIQCGLQWEAVERTWVARWLSRLRHPRLLPVHLIELPVRTLYASHWSLSGRGVPSSVSPDAAVYLPGRNVLLTAAAAIYGSQRGISTVALGTLGGNPFGDATPAFFRGFAACLRRALSQPVRLIAPLRRSTKAQLIAANPSLPFHLTWSCLNRRRGRHCGRCNKCAERRQAFHLARFLDPTAYAS